jgi:hypothetical protein
MNLELSMYATWAMKRASGSLQHGVFQISNGEISSSDHVAIGVVGGVEAVVALAVRDGIHHLARLATGS